MFKYISCCCGDTVDNFSLTSFEICLFIFLPFWIEEDIGINILLRIFEWELFRWRQLGAHTFCLNYWVIRMRPYKRWFFAFCMRENIGIFILGIHSPQYMHALAYTHIHPFIHVHTFSLSLSLSLSLSHTHTHTHTHTHIYIYIYVCVYIE